MTDDTLTQDEKINEDILNSFYSENIKVHIILKRTDRENKNIYLNGLLLRKASERVWVLQERVLGEVRVAISEIKSIEEYKEIVK